MTRLLPLPLLPWSALPCPATGCDVVGKSIRDSAFRSRFHAAVVAIKRNGMNLQWSGQQIGDEVLKVGAVPAVHAAPAVICCDWQAASQGAGDARS